MDYKKLESAVYSQGFVEDYLEKHAKEPNQLDAAELKHREEVLAAWRRVDAAFEELRKENAQMAQKLFAARTALA